MARSNGFESPAGGTYADDDARRAAMRDRDFEARREALTAEHGQGRHYPEATALRLLGGAGAGLNVNEAVAWLYPTREAAQAWHQLNHEYHGHTSLGIVAAPDGGGYIGVMDVRKQLGEMRARHEAQRRP